MNVGVIGGSGFIGSHLVDTLLAHDHEVTVFDMMKPHRNDVRHTAIDITDLTSVMAALPIGMDAVFLLAAMSDVNLAYSSPLQACEVNILGVANVLEACRRNQISRLILASTIWVYNLAREEKVNEYTPLYIEKADHVYTSSKVAAEMLCHSYQKLYGQDFTVLRYGIPYGPRARRGTVVELFVRKAMNGEPLTIQGDGSQSRNFLYVKDLAEGNVAALKEIARNRLYNLEGTKPVTVKEIAETVQQLVGKVDIQYMEARPGDYRGKTVSADSANNDLGWMPKVDFNEGLKRYIEWYRDNINARG